MGADNGRAAAPILRSPRWCTRRIRRRIAAAAHEVMSTGDGMGSEGDAASGMAARWWSRWFGGARHQRGGVTRKSADGHGHQVRPARVLLGGRVAAVLGHEGPVEGHSVGDRRDVHDRHPPLGRHVEEQAVELFDPCRDLFRVVSGAARLREREVGDGEDDHAVGRHVREHRVKDEAMLAAYPSARVPTSLRPPARSRSGVRVAEIRSCCSLTWRLAIAPEREVRDHSIVLCAQGCARAGWGHRWPAERRSPWCSSRPARHSESLEPTSARPATRDRWASVARGRGPAPPDVHAASTP